MHAQGPARNMRRMELAWRTLTRDDAEALAELNAAAEAVDKTDDHYGAEDFIEDLEGHSVDPVDGSRGGFVDGRPVVAGVVHARTAADPAHRMYFWGLVHPEFRRRGLGRALTEWALEAGARITERRFPGAPGELLAPVADTLAGNAALFQACGFTTDRYEFGMALPLAGREAATSRVPEGFTLFNYEDALAQEFRATHNDAFVPDHPGSTVQTVESWPHVADPSSPSFRQDFSFGLRDEATGVLAGYLFARYFEADTAATGRRDLYLNYIGTRREYRGRGIASALINTVADGAAAAGFDSVSLHVYADNPTGALGVYERVGFAVRHRLNIFKRPTSHELE